jgi:plastocyanin
MENRLSLDNHARKGDACPTPKEGTMFRPLLAGFAAGIALYACAAAPPPPRIHEVRMLGSTYAPARIEARVGDSLRFVNDDDQTHAVFVPTRGFATDLGNQRAGETREIRLAAPGRFDVECVPHAQMKLAVTVR